MVSASGALALLLRPGELYAAVKLKKQIKVWKQRAAEQKKDADWVFCFDMLNKVSRSFAIVIEQLGDEKRSREQRIAEPPWHALRPANDADSAVAAPRP